MAFIFHDEGELYLLQVGFDEVQSVPANFYVGLCNEVLTEAETLSTIGTEPSGAGYARQAVASDNTDIIVSQDDPGYKALLKEVTFLASGGNWGTISRWFICTVVSGTGGKLLASGDIDPTRTMNDGNTIELTTFIRIE